MNGEGRAELVYCYADSEMSIAEHCPGLAGPIMSAARWKSGASEPPTSTLTSGHFVGRTLVGHHGVGLEVHRYQIES